MNITRASRIFSFLLSLFIVIGITVINRETVLADSDVTTGLTYTITDGEAEITDFTAPAGFSGTLTIPATLGGASVTSIGNGAFSYCTEITSVALPNSLDTIGYDAFSGSGLTAVTVPAGVTSIGYRAFTNESLARIDVDSGNSSYASIDGVLFNKSMTNLIQYPIGSTATTYSIPEGVTDIDAGPFGGAHGGNVFGAFMGAENLTSVAIPSSLASLDSATFFDCPSLMQINVNSGNTNLKSINGVLFNYSADWLIQYPIGKTATAYEIPNGVKYINSGAFRDCKSLTGITIPSGVIEIGSEILSGWGYGTFSGCSGLTSVTIPGSVTNIGMYAFSSCDQLQTVTIMSGVPIIGGSMFAYCDELTEVSIPGSVEEIGWYAFSNCSKLESITIPDGVTIIGNYAFESTGLSSVTIPKSVTTIDGTAFSGCESLMSFSVDDANTVYKGMNGLLCSKDGTAIISCPAGITGSLIIPDGISSIGQNTFAGCSGLTDVTIPDSVTSIGESAFANCTDLASINIPNSITSLARSTFFMCTSLKSITIPSSVTSIDQRAFVYSGLMHVTFEGAVSVIGSGAFQEEGGSYYIIDDQLIDPAQNRTILFRVPSGMTAAYQSLLNESVMGETKAVVTETQAYNVSFVDSNNYDITLKTEIVAPGGTATAPTPPEYSGYTFTGWDIGFTNVQSDLIVTTIYTYNSVTDVATGFTYIIIDNEAIILAYDYPEGFSGTLTIPDKLGGVPVTTVGACAFMDTGNLTSVRFPKSITKIYYAAFYGCTSLTDAYFYGDAPEMGFDVFTHCATDFAVNYLGTTNGYTNPWNGFPAIPYIDGVSYRTHVQDVGWQDYVSNGSVSGTSAQSKRLEAIRIKLELEGVTGGVEYRTHVQDIGWQDWVANDALSGTSGQSKRLEAIEIRLTGEAATLYDVYYRVHAQEFGWMGWAKNGASAGTAGFSYRLEAIEIKMVEKDGAAPGSTEGAFVEAHPVMPIDPSTQAVLYKTHVQDVGWQDYVRNGEIAGTSGQSKRLEGIQIKLQNIAGGIEYSTHVQDIGWMDFVANDAMSGTSGQSKRLEAIKIRLTGEAATLYDVYYCVHAQNTGWLDWAKNGESAGTAGFSYRLEAIKIVLVPKGGAAPGPTTRAFVQG